MVRRPSDLSAGGDQSSATPAGSDSDTTRIDGLAAILDHCAAAQATADALGEKFLSYLIAMTIEATQRALKAMPK